MPKQLYLPGARRAHTQPFAFEPGLRVRAISEEFAADRSTIAAAVTQAYSAGMTLLEWHARARHAMRPEPAA
jgi:hypothetical protein